MKKLQKYFSSLPSGHKICVRKKYIKVKYNKFQSFIKTAETFVWRTKKGEGACWWHK